MVSNWLRLGAACPIGAGRATPRLSRVDNANDGVNQIETGCA
jgi:hypothetical protein